MKKMSIKSEGDISLCLLILLVIIIQQIFFLSNWGKLALTLSVIFPILICSLKHLKSFSFFSIFLILSVAVIINFSSSKKLLNKEFIILEGESLELTVKSLPREKRLGEYSFLSANSAGKYFLTQVPIFLYNDVSVGDTISIQGKFNQCGNLKKPPLQLTWCGYLYRRGINGTIRVESFKALTSTVSSKKKFIEDILLRFGEERKSLALILASSLAEKQLLGPSLTNLFKDFGLSHLLVVSGFHIGVFFSLSWFVINKFLKYFSYPLYIFPKTIYLASLSFLSSFIYVQVIGSQPSTSRALLALLFFSLAKIFGERIFFSRTFLVTALLIIVAWPGIWLEMGYQLTFAALAGIFFALRLIIQLKSKFELSRIQTHFLNLSLISVFAWVFTAPVLYFWTYEINYFQAFFNLAISPVFSFLCIAIPSICFLALYLKIPGANYLMSFCLYLVDYFILLLENVRGVLFS